MVGFVEIDEDDFRLVEAFGDADHEGTVSDFLDRDRVSFCVEEGVWDETSSASYVAPRNAGEPSEESECKGVRRLWLQATKFSLRH